MRFRRIIANIIDIIILLLVFAAMLSFIPLNDKIKDNYAKIDKIESRVSSYNDLTADEIDQINAIFYENEFEFVKYYLISSIILIVYFIFIPKWRKDQTIGQRILKIRLVNDDKITYNVYVIRTLLNTGLILTIVCPLLLYFLNRVWYSRVTSILVIIQLMYWIISFLMLLISKTTIHDKITKTRIIEVKR